jgi:DNA-directed RNA polymerase specialized sigma24 family protein
MSDLSARLTLVVEGDEDARGWLHVTFAPRLARRLRARYGRHPGFDVDEVLQDAFVSFYEHAPRTMSRFLSEVPVEDRSESRLDAYLWDVACGVASNRLRSLRRAGSLRLVPAEGAVDPQDEERRSLARDVLEKLTGCLKLAGSRPFLYYKLRFVDGFTPEEIALVTGWSRKATYKLRTTLDEAIDRCARRLGLR